MTQQYLVSGNDQELARFIYPPNEAREIRKNGEKVQKEEVNKGGQEMKYFCESCPKPQGGVSPVLKFLMLFHTI